MKPFSLKSRTFGLRQTNFGAFGVVSADLSAPILVHCCYLRAEAVSRHSKETGLVIYLAFLAKVANLYYIILTAFKKYWPDTVLKFISGTQDTFI